MQNDVVKLIKQTMTVNSTHEIYSRKLEAMEAGLKLEYKFTLEDEYEYEDEELLEFGGKRYNIVNVYINRFRQPELLTTRY